MQVQPGILIEATSRRRFAKGGLHVFFCENLIVSGSGHYGIQTNHLALPIAYLPRQIDLRTKDPDLWLQCSFRQKKKKKLPLIIDMLSFHCTVEQGERSKVISWCKQTNKKLHWMFLPSQIPAEGVTLAVVQKTTLFEVSSWKWKMKMLKNIQCWFDFWPPIKHSRFLCSASSAKMIKKKIFF